MRGSARVVVVDDDPEVLKILERILKKRKYEVRGFENPAEALEYVRRESVDLVLTDLKMPEMDGVQFLYRVKEIKPFLPIILITGFASVETAVRAMQWGAFDYLRKPFDIARIYQVVEQALRFSRGGK